MGERNRQTQAIILTLKPLGENNYLVTYICPDSGICTAALYGGPKSKLRSLIQPFNAGILYIYTDETKKTTKITDFDVKNYHLSLRNSLYKMWAANFALELTLKTKCAGEPEKCYPLLKGFLDGLEISDEKSSRMGTIRFLWRYLGLLGLQPDTTSCSSCSTTFDNQSTEACYIEQVHGFVCQDCISGFSEYTRSIKAGPQALSYLTAMNHLQPSQIRSIKISETSYNQLKTLLFYMAENSTGLKFNSLKSGMGIL